MSVKPKRVAVIGFDCAQPGLIERHIREGHLPVFKKMIENGVFAENCLGVFPTITPPNWTSIATGAWPGTHSVTDFHLPDFGKTPENSNTFAAFGSKNNRAEFIWDRLDAEGKKCVVVNYPGSWPSRMKNGIMIGGAGITVGEFRDGYRGLDHRRLLSADNLITTGSYPGAIRGIFAPASGWLNLGDAGDDPLEMKVDVAFPGALEDLVPLSWYLLVRKNKQGDYSRLTLSPVRDMKKAFFTIEAGNWSPKTRLNLKTKAGQKIAASFRAKLIELSEDAEDFRLYLTEMDPDAGWSQPPEVTGLVKSEEGIITASGGTRGYAVGWFDLVTWAEINELHDIWLADAVVALLKNQPWDFFIMHSHPPDWLYHVALTNMDSRMAENEDAYRKAWEVHLKVYQSQDRMLGRIIEVVGKDSLVVLVSDHGAVPSGPTFNPYDALAPAGLTAMKEKAQAGEKLKLRHGMYDKLSEPTMVPVAGGSKALAQRNCHVYVHLKGRDPEGVVEPTEFEDVQRQIIDALYRYVDPATGLRPVALALTKNDARILGLYGDNTGDVVYALYPEYGSQHGQQLPTAGLGPGSLKTLLLLNGPGVKKNLRLERTCRLVDIVPTICYLMDWAVPRDAEGSIIYQALA